MIDVLTHGELRELAGVCGRYCVSMYLPTHRAGGETAQDPIRLRNLLGQAQDELESLGLRATEARDLLSPAMKLESSPTFWAHLEPGLAVFLTPEGMRTYRVADPVDELVVVAERLHLKDLIPSLTTGQTFHLLALSQNRVRLLRGTRERVTELDVEGIPASLAEALQFDDRESQLQSHGADRTGAGNVVASFHGQGVGKDTERADIERFLHSVDDAVRHVLAEAPTPLVLAGVVDLVSHYRKVSKYSGIVSGHIAGNPDETSAEELGVEAWSLAEPEMRSAERDARSAIQSGATPTLHVLAEVLDAAADRRVDSLFVLDQGHRWGTFDVESRSIDEHDSRQAGDSDLLDVAATVTLEHHGAVHVVEEVPGPGPVNAVLRY